MKYLLGFLCQLILTILFVILNAYILKIAVPDYIIGAISGGGYWVVLNHFKNKEIAEIFKNLKQELQ